MNNLVPPLGRRNRTSAAMRWCVKWWSRFTNTLRLASLPRHRAHVEQSRDTLRLIRRFDGPYREARALTYLRKIHPNVFEELVLSALEEAGYQVRRNLRYSGDGGIDGRVRVAGRWWPVQVKRYSSHIDHRHVDDFIQLVQAEAAPGGLFVHSGRSGGAVYRQLKGSGVWLISGERLLALIFHPMPVEQITEHWAPGR